MAAPGKANLAELVRRSTQTHGGRACWAHNLEGDVLKYLEAIEALEEPPVYARVTEILREEFGIRLAKDTVRKHLRKECACHRR